MISIDHQPPLIFKNNKIKFSVWYLYGGIGGTVLVSNILYCQTPVLGLGLGVDFTFAWDNNDNNNNNNNKNHHLNFLERNSTSC